jgi:hypothetical protein
MRDPNRIVERVEKCLRSAMLHLDEARTIANCPEESKKVQKAAQELLDKFFEEVQDLEFR